MYIYICIDIGIDKYIGEDIGIDIDIEAFQGLL